MWYKKRWVRSVKLKCSRFLIGIEFFSGISSESDLLSLENKTIFEKLLIDRYLSM